MPKIAVMSDTLASQVAAGEVIERPASVIKELIENSIDAGARRIEVDIQRGGIALMRVRDDGSGMSGEDARLSLERHATSKLRLAGDLNTIMTLGFRGEALPSIASVSRFSLSTRDAESVEGSLITVEGGNFRAPQKIGTPVGTCIEVRDLFFNVPARKKFMRAESTESAHIDHQMRLHALSTPEIGWVLRRDGRVVFDLPATSDRRVRIEAMAGREASGKLLEVPPTKSHGLQIRGAILPAEFARGGRKHQSIFLNGRPVEDATISKALRDAFRGSMADGLHPAAWLWLEIPPGEVDVNVHPAKREVRFREPAKVRLALLEALEEALRPKPKTRELTLESRPHGERETFHPPEIRPAQKAIWQHSHQRDLPVEEDEMAKEKKITLHASAHPDFRVIGRLSKRYALLEGDEGLVLLEPKAARERITYERLLARAEGVASQGLLVPLLLELDARDTEILMRMAPHFEEAGFSLAGFGGQTIQIAGIPAFLELGDTRPFLTELVDSLVDREGLGRVKNMTYEAFAARVALASTRRATWDLSGIDALLNELFACDLPYCDPIGKPTMIQLSYQELDRKFGK